MREILFRGKRCDNGKWVEGYLYVTHNGEYEIGRYNAEVNIERMTYVVDPDTVGQYTGLTDKNGKRIFEGDIVKQTFEKTVAVASDEFWDDNGYADLYGEDVGKVVILPSKGTCIKNPVIHREVNGEITEDRANARMYKNVCSGRCEIIGNIHDNPELLKGE